MKKYLLPGIVIFFSLLAFSSIVTAANHSPPNCNADNSVVNIARSKSVASVGDTITFTVSAGNPVSVDGCDIIGRTMTLILPDGSTHVFGPNNYPNPTVVNEVGHADYVAKLADVVGGTWAATVSWTGTQQDGFDSPSTGSKGTSVTYIQPLQVTKTAVPAIQQTYTWTINKSVTPAAFTLLNGSSTGTSEYTVAVVKSLSGTVYTVSGTISIHNPNPIDANISDVSDAITGIGTVSVSCSVSLPHALAAGADLSCTYSSNLPDATARTNTATVTTTGDIVGGSGTAIINFTGVAPTIIGGSINVDDTNGGKWAFNDSGSVNYSRTFDCSGLTYDSSGHASYCRTNIATIRGTQLSTNATVCVTCHIPIVPGPQVYLLKKVFDICDQNGGQLSESTPLPGGSVPPSGITGEGESQSGCVDVIGDRANEYLFTGEQMGVLVAVRDVNGGEDISGANLFVDDIMRVKCNDITDNATALKAGTALWYGHNVSDDLSQQPPASAAGNHDGFDPGFDRLYQCVFTATPYDPEVAVAGDSSQVTVQATNGEGEIGMSVPDTVWLNPAITLDIYTVPDGSLTFPAGTPNQTVYSLGTLQIKNTAEGGVDLVAWMAGTDLFASDGVAKCPYTNVIDISKTMEYRCKIGTIFNNPWTYVPHSNDKEDCTMESCQGALPLMPAIWASNSIPSIIVNGHTAECYFRFTYPTPVCVGNFDQGGEIVIYARAI